jgi:hypothetical protein
MFSVSHIFKTVNFNLTPILQLQKEHRGTYYCVATNVVGQGARRNIDVEVEFAPSIKVVRKRVGQALQFDADLECHIEAYPPPAIKWYRDNILLSNNQVDCLGPLCWGSSLHNRFHFSITGFLTLRLTTSTPTPSCV